ncbi:hypothetical protein HZS_2273 [Henneguya salminicola]|nr:hypothetical protein HZS_2273 [Henneguya salminicola]
MMLLTKRSAELFEEVSKIRIYENFIRLEISNSKSQKVIIDKSSWITFYHSFNYRLDGAVGTLGQLKLYMNIQ